MDGAQQQRKLTNFVTSSTKKIVKAELLFSGFLVQHNLPFVLQIALLNQ